MQGICLSCKKANCNTRQRNLMMLECSEYEPQTNGDHIRAMTDEELSFFLRKIIEPCKRCPCDATCPITADSIDCAAMLEEWLKKERIV